MYVRRKIRARLVWRFAARNVARFTAWALALTAAQAWLRSRGLSLGLPFLPIGTIGTAVAFYLGFKNSQSYDRFWEGRKLWGGIVNVSRSFANDVLAYVPRDAGRGDGGDGGGGGPGGGAARRLVYRHLAWVNALRLQLRRTTIFDRENLSYVPDLRLAFDRDCTETLRQFVPEAELAAAAGHANAAAQLLRAQAEDLRGLRERGAFGEFQHVAMMNRLADLYDLQGGCERIKNTPFPRQYAYFSAVFVWLFVALVPFGLINEFEKLGRDGLVWLAVPFSVLISWVFTTIEIVGDNSEDPFENYINDVPMSAICRTIEIDLRQMLGEADVPAPLKPVDDILL